MNVTARLSVASRKLFFVLIGMMVLVMPNFVIPKVATLNPAIHSKTLMLRWLLGALGISYIFAKNVRRRAPLCIAEISILAFVFANILSAIISRTPLFSLTDSWQLWSLALVSIGLMRLAPTYAEADRLIKLALVGGVIAALYGFSVYAGFDVLREYYPFAYSRGDARNYIHSFLGNPEYFGGYMAALAVLSYGLALASVGRPFSRMAWVALCFFYLAAIVLSGTRGAILGSFVGIALVSMQFYRTLPQATRKRILVALVVLLGAVVVLVTIFSVPSPLNVRRMRVAQRFLATFDLASDSVRERILFFSVASRIVRDHPLFGVGPGCFKLYFYPTVAKLVEEDERAGFRHFAMTLQGRVAEHAHNDYLEFLSDTGIVGFATFAFVIASLLWLYRYVAQLPAPHENSGEEGFQLWSQATTCFGAMACLLVNALFSFPLHLPVRAALFWILVGIFLAAAQQMKQRFEV
jgi:O-antigen ligase